MRATVIAGARQITGTVRDARNNYVPLPAWYPNYAIGFGRTVLDNALYAARLRCYRKCRCLVLTGCCRYISNASSVAGLAIAFDVSSNYKLWVLYSAASARAFKFRCASYADTTVHIVLAWSDPAGNPAALKQIVNDLDLIVFVDSGAQIFGNTQSFPDTSNTVEKVVVACPSGSVITAIVNSGSMISYSQTFALVANGNVETEFAQAASPVPDFKSGRTAPIPTSKTACSLSSERSVQVTAPMTLKDTVKWPDAPLPLANVISRFGGALAMFLGVPLLSVEVYTAAAVPWIGFACGAYVCSAYAAEPCYQVGNWDCSCNYCCYCHCSCWVWHCCVRLQCHACNRLVQT